MILMNMISVLIKKHFENRKFKFFRPTNYETLVAQINAVVCATLLDMDIAISVYIDAAEEARVAAEAKVLAEERARVVNAFGGALAKMAEMDLSARIDAQVPDAYRKLQGDFDEALGRVADAFREVSSSTITVNTGAQEIASASEDLAQRTEEQAAALEESAAAITELSATVRTMAEGAQQARGMVESACEEAQRGSDAVTHAVEAMDRIEKSSGKISKFIGLIDEIAFQTNLLALNAGVEAARAGDAGKGFAVVASEVRALAQRAADAAREIKDLISSSNSEVVLGVELVAKTGKILNQIDAKVKGINSFVGNIATGTQEQATGLQQIGAAVSELEGATQQNAAMAEQATAASGTLAKECKTLFDLVGRFKLDDQPPARIGINRTSHSDVRASVAPRAKIPLRA